MTTWKAVEREVARRLGGRRVPITGRQRGDVPDVEHPVWSVEVKHRRVLPGWLHTAMSQAICAVRDDQVPIVVLHEAGRLHDGDYVVVRQQPEAADGDIVVALLEDEATVKRLRRRRNRVYLEPANRNLQPIVAEDVQIIGKVLMSIRRYA